MKLKKGLSAFVSIVFVILLGITMISIVFTALGKIQIDASTQASQGQVDSIARDLGSEIVNVYQSIKDFGSDPAVNSTVLVKEVNLNLPDKVGGKNYRLDLEEPSNVLLGVSEFLIDGLEVNSTTNRPTSRIVATIDGGKTVSQRIYNVDVGLQGSSKGGAEKLRGYRYKIDNDIREKIILGSDTIIVGVKTLQTTAGSGCESRTNITIDGHALYTTGGVVSGNVKVSIVETNDNIQSTIAGYFSTTFCATLTNQTEYTALVNVVDAQGNSGFLRKKLLV